MAMVDKIWRGTGNIPTDMTNFLPTNFFAPIVPVNMEVEDVFSLEGSVPTGDEFRPIRVFFLEEINAYLLFDVGNPTMVAIYLIDNDTKEMLSSFTYMVDSCPIYKKYDQFVDCCVHHDSMAENVQVTFLIVNDMMRSATIARFKLQVDHVREPYNEANEAAYYINMSDLTFFADIVAPGAEDAIALPFVFETVRSFGSPPTVYRSPRFIVDGIVKRLRETFHVGHFTPKYCSLTLDESGRYAILLGSRMSCYIGPHLPFPLDTQYVVLVDQGGMNQRFFLIGPYANVMCWDETERHQPTKFNATIFDGRYILCLEDRRSRYIAPRRIFVNDIATEPSGGSYTESTKNWRGGAVADVYYPPQQARTVYPEVENYVEIGYPSVWDEVSVLEPIHREYIWTAIDICDLVNSDAPLPTPQTPYAADIVVLVDVSMSMGKNITQVKSNVGTLASTLANLRVTDERIGVAAYTTGQLLMTLPNGMMWATNATEATTLASGLGTDILPNDSVTHNVALQFVTLMYKFRESISVPKYIVLVTDAGDEGDEATLANTVRILTEKGIKVCVVSYPENKEFFTPLIEQTGGVFYTMTTNWGPRVSGDLAQRVSDDVYVIGEPDFWTKVVNAWQPSILYNFKPVMGAERNSLVTVFHDSVSYISDGHVIRNSVNFLVVYDDYPVNGGMPQNSIYVPGIVPGETTSRTIIVRNESTTGFMKNITLELVDVPPDVIMEILDFPEKLEPREMVVITVNVSYSPTISPVARHIDVKYKVTYWMQHILTCRSDDPTPPPVEEAELYFVSNTSVTAYIPGLNKEIPMAPMFTDAYITTVTHDVDDVAKAQNMANANFYIISKAQMDSANYERVAAGAMSALAGRSIADTACAWLKITGPMHWHTQRAHRIDANIVTWWIVNVTSDASFVAHVHMNMSSISELNNDMKRMGFLLVEYPNGNIIPPGESRPVTFKWRPIFDPVGEQMTFEKTQHAATTSLQTNYPFSMWPTNDAMFNNIIYTFPRITPTFQFTHIWEETVVGDGLDMTIPKDYPLNKFDTKLLAPYALNTELTVDISKVVNGFPFVTPELIWGGHRIDPETGDPVEEVIWDGVSDPFAHYTYKEYASPVSGIECLPSYVDHRFKANPDYNYHADINYPFQLAPFNKQYATDYVATAFYGNVIVRSETVAHTKYVDMTVYDDAGSDLVPCDASGNELAGWLFEDFLPDANYTTAIQKMATENEITFSREVYVKNRGTNTLPVVINLGPSMTYGLSLQGIEVGTPNPLPPNGVVKVTLILRLHYGYYESGYVNMVQQLLLVPRFNV